MITKLSDLFYTANPGTKFASSTTQALCRAMQSDPRIYFHSWRDQCFKEEDESSMRKALALVQLRDDEFPWILPMRQTQAHGSELRPARAHNSLFSMDFCESSWKVVLACISASSPWRANLCKKLRFLTSILESKDARGQKVPWHI